MANENPSSTQSGEQVGAGEPRPSRRRRFIGKLLGANVASKQSTSSSRSTSQLSLARKEDDGTASVWSAGCDEEDQIGTTGNAADNESTQDPGDETDMWAEAEKKLREDPAKRKKLDEYNEILAKRFGEPLQPIGTSARLEQFQRFLERELAAKKLSDAEDGTPLDDCKRTAQRIIKVVAKTIVASNNVIGPATSSCLPAGVACTGVVVVVSFCLKAVDQRDLLLESLDNIAHSVCRIADYEKLCRLETATKSVRTTAHNETKAAFIQACSSILEFQARVLCFLHKNSCQQFARNMFEYDGWDKLLKSIKDAEERIFLCAQRQQMEKTALIFQRVDKVASELQQQSRARNDQWLDDKASRFLQTLYNSTCRYQEAKERNKKPVSGTCQWFTNHALFNGWRAGAGASDVLYVTADPGCGKSVLSRYLVDKVLADRGEAVCYFFFKDDFPDQKTAISALCALVHQLFDTHRHLLTPDVLDEYSARGQEIATSFTDLWQIFVQAASTQRTVCVLDGLDECHEGDMKMLIQKIVASKVPGLRFMFTSRPYAYIRQTITLELHDHVGNEDISYVHLQGDGEESSSQIAKEIALVVDARVNNIAKAWRLSEDEKQLMLDQVSSIQNRTYLWIALIFDGLINEKATITKREILALTKQLPKGIYQAYERILQKSQDQERTRRLLHLILGAQRPLTLTEVSVALELRSPTQPWEEVQDGVLPESRAKEAIRDLCGLFVTVVDNRVYLLHQTAREFLLSNGPEPSKEEAQRAPVPEHHGMSAGIAWTVHVWTLLFAWLLRVLQPLFHQLWLSMTNSWQHSMDRTASSEILAAACMACLQPGFPRDEYPSLFEYAADHWPAHYRQSSSRFRAKMGKAAHDLCLGSPSNLRWAHHNLIGRHITLDGLHLASFRGLDGAVEEFLKEIYSSTQTSAGSEINKKVECFSFDRTALSLAASEGHADVVRLLLERNAEVDLKDSKGWTPLTHAAGNGHEKVVQLLLEKNAEVDSKAFGGMTPLFRAAGNGHEKVIQLLLEKNAEVDLKDSNGWTPLHHAAGYGNEKVVQLLLEKNAEVDSKALGSMTPLFRAAGNGHEKVIQLLLEKNAEVDSKASNGYTPLYYAAWNGHEKVVQLLLEKNAEVDSKDSDCCTPLFYAAWSGHEKVVQLLLEKNAEVDLKDSDCCTPLFYAAWSGHEKVVQLLLEKNAEVDLKDSEGCTPLFYAVKGEHATVAKMLLDTGKVDTADESYAAAMEEAKGKESQDIYNILSAYKSDGSARDSHEVQEQHLSEAAPSRRT